MYHEIADILFDKEKKIEELNKNPYDHNYGNKVALINEEYRIKVARIIYMETNKTYDS